MGTRCFLRWGMALSICLLLIPALVYAQDTHPPVEPTPTIDRLAAPPTVPAPTQADEGAQLFWLYCQPCHGDQGQGLTDEWRAQFPEEEQYCWQSGCHSEHGKDLPENGFVLPTAVPAVIGEGTLEKFVTAHQLYAFISSAMPYEAPGRLTEEEYLAITAYIARAHGAWDGTPLNEDNLVQMRLTSSGEDELSAGNPAGARDEDQAGQSIMGRSVAPLFFGSIMLVTIIAGGAWLWHRREQ